MTTAIHHRTTQIEQSQADAALTALGIPEEMWKDIERITIDPKTVTIHVRDRNEKGNFYVLLTPLGRAIAGGDITFRIVPDGTPEDDFRNEPLTDD